MTEHSTAVRNNLRGSTKQPVRSKPRNGHRHGGAAQQTPQSVTPTPADFEPVAAESDDKGRFGQIRSDLVLRHTQLHEEYRLAMAELRTLQRDRHADASGDDQADAGTKTHQREQELTLAHGILDRIEQVERAISRIDEETYGQCERCGNQIPIARLEAFPSATLCVGCKQRQERR